MPCIFRECYHVFSHPRKGKHHAPQERPSLPALQQGIGLHVWPIHQQESCGPAGRLRQGQHLHRSSALALGFRWFPPSGQPEKVIYPQTPKGEQNEPNSEIRLQLQERIPRQDIRKRGCASAPLFVRKTPSWNNSRLINRLSCKALTLPIRNSGQ